MAQKISVILIDDLDESEASETVSFALDGSTYEIDLNDEHAKELRDVLEPWVASGRRAGRAPARRTAGRSPRATPASSDREQTQIIRDWGRQHGHRVSDRGRLSAELIAAYEAAS